MLSILLVFREFEPGKFACVQYKLTQAVFNIHYMIYHDTLLFVTSIIVKNNDVYFETIDDKYQMKKRRKWRGRGIRFNHIQQQRVKNHVQETRNFYTTSGNFNFSYRTINIFTTSGNSICRSFTTTVKGPFQNQQSDIIMGVWKFGHQWHHGGYKNQSHSNTTT